MGVLLKCLQTTVYPPTRFHPSRAQLDPPSIPFGAPLIDEVPVIDACPLWSWWCSAVFIWTTFFMCTHAAAAPKGSNQCLQLS